MNTAVQPDSKLQTPCKECIVRATCTQFCLPWISHCRNIFPHDVEIPFTEFQKVMDTCGPFDNYFKENFRNITNVSFPDKTGEKLLIAVENKYI